MKADQLSAPTSISGPENDFGTTLRVTRKSFGLTLDTLALKSGVSKSTLSRIENGRLSPTYEVICKIASGMGLSVARFFAEPEKEAFRGWRAVTRVTDRTTHNTQHYDLQMLCQEVANRNVLVFTAIITARSLEDYESLASHVGEEQIFVLSGTIEVHTEFYETTQLGVGDSIAFDSRMGHAIISISDQNAEVLWITDGHKPDVK